MTTTTDITAKRQHVTVSIHLGRQYGQFAPDISPATPEQTIAAVEIVAGLRVQTEDPSIFRQLAQSFLAAADSIDAARCSACSKPLHDEDPSNTGLGYHVDCTTDGALAGLPS